MAGIGIKYSIEMGDSIKKWGTAWTKSLDYLGETSSMASLAMGYRYYMNQFVPKKTGALRKSARVVGNRNMASVFWLPNKSVQDYLHYQFVGDVWGPNKAIFAQGPNQNGVAGVHAGWVSPPSKTNQNRKMGTPFTYRLKDGRLVNVRGYTTPGTRYEWIDKFKEDTGDNGEAAINIRAGRYIYELYCMKSQHTGYPQSPVGGYQVYHSWKQIEKIRT